MRVVMLTWEYPPAQVGGISPHVLGLSRALVRRGVAVDVLTRAAPGAAGVAEEDGVRVHRVHPYFGNALDFPGWIMHLNFALAEAGIRLLGRSALQPPAGGAAEDEVVLHAHDWVTAYAGRLLKHAFRLPLVATVHATEHGRMRGLHHAGHKYIHDVEWWLTYEAWRVITCSRAMQHEVRRLFGLPEDKVRVVPNGIDVPPHAERLPEGAPPREFFAAPWERIVYHLGRLVPEKGAGVLLEAFPDVLAAFPEAKLVIAGGGPWEGELRARAAALGLGPKVYFTGYLQDPARWALFHYADVAVFPSTYEPFGIVALEAMTAGTPLVVSDVGGLAELVEHGVDGRKALPGHPDSLAEQIKAALADPAGSREMARRAREKVAARYTWSSVARATAAIYEEVLREWRQSPWVEPPRAGQPAG
ncbi:glycosyltransferase family 4 protein [Caldinitratiruptor microaerophilus]|uniref:Glycosyl transferase family 1 n=1 Tax=Caldinitratiruptor microaerophilus TaxID=671077 RepID=A0AA35CP86_9FIRM|nr:glycosyltransferase family 4 protein [Caldinitratiruptor microaerophilus]BDG62258.1 glycosyl transferase family 1 [Caldinitratiruptor microaerophilus]